ncbi:hypothetical protein P7D22_13515 [Lichenihabitans sp. Uapishka_5]|uniref:hypothetical protein n=1 Tax=Lichenihabitans sp. Uapishka_5 TaxID=3037302 RepID=UPI0029E7CFB6|nr:hypothetical protein [Lichenihabitans sp. Uapishka_5]MDX7952194.1 hypothetical protein [Lichenihabitans sp. Uapishka_5]
MRVAAVLLLLASTAVPALALDVARLPDSCKAYLDASKADKPNYAQLSGTMQKARKANDNASFCSAAKALLAVVVGENGSIDQCLGDLAVDKTATPDTVSQFAQVKDYYRKMVAAAKDPANDHLHCGLADQ